MLPMKIDLSSLPALLTIDAVSEALHVHRTTVFRWLADGKLTRLKLGRSQKSRVLIQRNELEAYLAECRRPAATPRPDAGEAVRS